MLHSVVGRVTAVTALGAAAIGATLALFFAANSSLSRANQDNARAAAISAAAFDLREHVLDLDTAFQAVVQGRGSRFQARWQTAKRTWRAPAAQLEQAAAENQGLEEAALALRARIEAYINDYGDPVIAIAQISPAAARSTTALAEGTIRIGTILKSTDNLSRLAAQDAARRSVAANRLAHRATIAGLAALVFAPLLLIAIAIWLARSVAAPLRRTVDASSSVAAGDFSVRLDERRRDEFGELGRGFNAMTASLAASHDELVERADSLEQAERHKSELISMVSHEVRTPLASILGFTRLLLERDLDETDRRRYLGIVDAEATRLAALVSDFLDARLIEEGQFALRPELFDVRSLVLEQAELALGHDNSHELELQLHETPLYVQADRSRLTQVVANLLSNAVKYSPTGGTITVGATPNAAGARIWVDDEGTGIAPEHREQIFEPFYRGGAPRGGHPRHGARARRLCAGSSRLTAGRSGSTRWATAPGSGSSCPSSGRSTRESRTSSASLPRVRRRSDRREFYGGQTPAHAGRRGRGLLESLPSGGPRPRLLSARRETVLRQPLGTLALDGVGRRCCGSPEGRGLPAWCRRPARPPAPRVAAVLPRREGDPRRPAPRRADGRAGERLPDARCAVGAGARPARRRRGRRRAVRAGPACRPSSPLRVRGLREGRSRSRTGASSGRSRPSRSEAATRSRATRWSFEAPAPIAAAEGKW